MRFCSGFLHAFLRMFGARNQNAGTIVTSGDTGKGLSTANLCGATVDGATVICRGDITTPCAGVYRPV